MAGSGVGDLGGLSIALFRYYGDQDLREEPTFGKVLEHTQHKNRANEAALAVWMAATPGIDCAAEWDQ
jgi:hypothetical protein